MSDEPVTLDISDGIATVTLARPKALNALSQPMMNALARRIDAVEARPDVRVVILTGTGRAFSAGGDLIEFERALRADKNTLLTYLRDNQDILQRVEDIPVPVIAAVNGFAVAGGLELLLCCDIVVAAEGARIGDGHAQYGIVPAGGATVRLRERLSPSHAAQLFYTAGLLDAGTLMDWGLVNDVVPSATLMERARGIAREIAGRSPEAIGHIKTLIGGGAGAPDRAERLRAELDRFALHVDGADLAKGLEAFRTKQPAQF